jgi:DNA-binding NarL/FixJ family response regulator
MRIILADPHVQALSALETALQEEPGLELIGLVMNAESLLRLAEQDPADLYLVDCELPGKPFGELSASLHALEPKPVVMIMSSSIEYSQLLKAGADAFVSKTDQPDWLLEKLQQYAKQVKKK